MLRGASRTVAALAAALVLTACTAGDGSSGTGSPTGETSEAGTTAASGGGDATPRAKPSTYLPVPAGVELTDPGSELGFGEQATVAWRPSKGGDVGVLDAKVRKVVHADIKALQNWQLDAAGRGSSLYYVMMTVAKVRARGPLAKR